MGELKYRSTLSQPRQQTGSGQLRVPTAARPKRCSEHPKNGRLDGPKSLWTLWTR